MGSVNTANIDNYSNPTAYDLINFLKATCQVKTCERKFSCPYIPQYDFQLIPEVKKFPSNINFNLIWPNMVPKYKNSNTLVIYNNWVTLLAISCHH